MSALLKVNAACVHFAGVAALSQINLELAAGERLALIGANGSGKSTLLRLLHGLIQPGTGSVWRVASIRQAMVFQRPHMLRAGVLANVALGLWLAGKSWGQAKEEALSALARVGLAQLAHRPAQVLSGGQQARLALARAFSLTPAVLLLDELTASLDPHAAREIEALLIEIAQAGMTLVFASHNLGQVRRLATRVVYLEQGQLLADLPVQQFFDRAQLGRISPQAELYLKGELL